MKLIPIVLLALPLASCGGGHEAAPAAGNPATADQADRTIVLTADDPYNFSPEDLSAEVGETILFEVTNEGQQDHEFVLGAGGHGSHEAGTHIHLAPGATEQLVWEFTEAGDFEFGCHIDNHYESGMKGNISIAE